MLLFHNFMSQRIPFNVWPLKIKIVAKLSNASDKGAGDTIARVIGPIGGDLYKKWLGCTKCEERQESLNQKYQY